jgi:hypothetical protein
MDPDVLTVELKGVKQDQEEKERRLREAGLGRNQDNNRAKGGKGH